jgi:hypothetical protein
MMVSDFYYHHDDYAIDGDYIDVKCFLASYTAVTLYWVPR